MTDRVTAPRTPAAHPWTPHDLADRVRAPSQLPGPGWHGRGQGFESPKLHHSHQAQRLAEPPTRRPCVTSGLTPARSTPASNKPSRPGVVRSEVFRARQPAGHGCATFSDNERAGARRACRSLVPRITLGELGTAVALVPVRVVGGAPAVAASGHRLRLGRREGLGDRSGT